MKGYATLFLSIGVILSLMSIGIAAGHGAGGWIIAIIIMALYWVIIPKYLIYKEDQLDDPATLKTYYDAHPDKVHCPDCYSVLTDLMGQKYEAGSDTKLFMYKCRQCGRVYEWTQHVPVISSNICTGVFKEQEKANQQNTIALIDCPACGHKVSNQAPACPNCGQPIKPPEVPRPAATSTSKFCCPKCHSTDYRKIDSLERAASAQLWGVGSGKIGKQYKCNKCGHMW